MATIKSYTNIEQSKKLAEILPVKSADMVYIDAGYCSRVLPSNDIDANSYPTICPCWSLAALLNILPETIEDEFAEYDLEIDMIYKKPEYVRLCDCHHSDFPSWEWDDTKELLDNIVEAVIWLNNNGYLRDEKLY